MLGTGTIYYDFRETRSGVPEILRRRGWSVEGADLEEDYVLGNCRVERKTVGDFVASIVDRRLFRQVHVLSQAKYPVLLLEGGGLYASGRVGADIIRGAMLWVAVAKKVALVRTKDIQDTASVLSLLAKRYLPQITQVPKRQRHTLSPWQRQIKILGNISGIGPALAKNILNAFGSLDKLSRISDPELMVIPGLGKERIKSIRQIFPLQKTMV